jgi:acyl dehydratase
MDVQRQLERERAQIGVTRGPTRWREVTQESVSTFGACTDDPDPMHIDPEWAARLSPFGQTIAFGFWTLSMTTSMLHEIASASAETDEPPTPHHERIGVNYGCDYLRFIEPVPVGGRIRLWSKTLAVETPAPDRISRQTEIKVEIEHNERPALVAIWRSITLFRNTGLVGFRPAAEA